MIDFLKNEDGNSAVELACLFPVILGLIMFALFVNMFYEGKIATSIGANEALRYGVTQKDLSSAQATVKDRLKNVYKQHNIKYSEGEVSLVHQDTNRDGKYSIGDTLILKVHTKKGIWCTYDYELRAKVEDDNILRG